MDKPDFTNKCYKTKDGSRHTTAFSRGDPSKETAEDREIRLKNLRENRGVWVYDEKQGKVVRKEDCLRDDEIDAPQVSRWDSEWSVISTGRRMSKGELKRYCKEKGKIWEA